MKTNRPVILASIGGAVLIAGVVTFAFVSSTNTPSPTPTAAASTVAPSFDASQFSSDELAWVYPQVTELGLVPEPITTVADEYVAAVVAAFGTYDTTGVTTMKQWKQYLESWQNVYPDVVEAPNGERYEFGPLDENPVMRVAENGHRDVWVIGEKPGGSGSAWEGLDWNMLRSRQGKVITEATAVGEFEPVPVVSSNDLGERRALVQFTQWVTMDDGTDGEHTITLTQHGTALVRVNCTITEPAPDSAQQPGDCKLMALTVQDYK